MTTRCVLTLMVISTKSVESCYLQHTFIRSMISLTFDKRNPPNLQSGSTEWFTNKHSLQRRQHSRPLWLPSERRHLQQKKSSTFSRIVFKSRYVDTPIHHVLTQWVHTESRVTWDILPQFIIKDEV